MTQHFGERAHDLETIYAQGLRIKEQETTGPISRYVSGAYDVDGDLCPILNMYMLAEDPEFQVVAA